MRSGIKSLGLVVAAMLLSGLPSVANAQLWDGGLDVINSSGKQVAHVFTTRHQSSPNQCTYTEHWFLLKGFKYIGSSSTSTLTFTNAKYQYTSVEEFEFAMGAEEGRRATVSVVEEGACTGSTI